MLLHIKPTAIMKTKRVTENFNECPLKIKLGEREFIPTLHPLLTYLASSSFLQSPSLPSHFPGPLSLLPYSLSPLLSFPLPLRVIVLKDYFTFNNVIRTTRQSDMLHLPRVRTETAKRSFYCNGCKIFNRLNS